MLEVASLKNSESPDMKYSLCRVFLLSKETLFDCRKDKGKKLFAWNVISQNAKFYRISICSTCSDVEFSFGGVVVSECCDMAGKFKN